KDVQNVVKRAHIYLDAFPFAGACSMLDPIAVGVPPVAWSGSVGRSIHGACLMQMVGLEEFVCRSEDEYVATVVDLAANAVKRDRIRDALLAPSSKTPVYLDTKAFSHKVGDTLSRIYERHCDGFSRFANLAPAAQLNALSVLAQSVVERSFELSLLTDT